MMRRPKQEANKGPARLFIDKFVKKKIIIIK